jgi:putative ABC transport system permease protein
MLMQAFLYGISALVVIAFITVWTVQRTRDVAVLRALGASRGYLVRDSLVQATLVVGIGVLIGAVVGGLMGWLVATQVTAVPFLFSLTAVAVPALGVLLLGIVGSLLAVRRVAKVDPMIALGGN